MRLTRRFFCASAGSAALVGARAGAASEDVVVVTIKKFKFEPQEVTIKPGQAVEWVNQDFAPHTATELEYDWDTGALGKAEKAALTFESEGEFDYFCIYHPHMTGRITVKA